MTATAADADVVVIGGGIAGCTAALSAAQAGGSASVRLVTADESTLRAASGLVDVLGYTPDGEGPLRDPFAAIPDLPETHPYRTVGVEAVRDGLSVFDDAVGDAYRGAHTDLNALVPTGGGAPKPTARYPESVAAGLTARTDDMLLVGFDQLTAMDAHLMADQLQNMGVPFATMGVAVRFPVDVTDYPAAPRMAAALEADEPVTGTAYEGDEQPRSLREALAEAVYEYHGFQDRVGLPAVLGTSDHDVIREAVADRVSAEVFEIPLGPPSILGQRLGRLLFDALEAHGVTVDVGTRVVDVATSDGPPGGAHVDGVVLETGDGRETIEPGAVVLATGGVAGGGIESDRTAVREPLFDCHVDAPDDREDWYAREFFGDHPFARFGVHPDDDLRPLDAGGTPEYENLHAAGAVLDGYDFAAEKSGGGVSIATGYVAGRRALESD